MRLLTASLLVLVLAPLPTAAAQRTQVVLFSPWTMSGEIRSDLHVSKTVSGYCWTASIAASRPDAWRCQTDQKHTEYFDGKPLEVNDLWDPCFSGSSGRVACVPHPFSKSVIVLRLTKPIDAPPLHRSPQPAPWALRLTNGATCELVTGATGVVAGMRLNYACGNGAWLLGDPDRSSDTWTIFYLKSQQDSNATQARIQTALL